MPFTKSNCFHERKQAGDWRIILVEDVRSITVVAVGHRSEIYD